jgi:hypothetical protein
MRASLPALRSSLILSVLAIAACSKPSPSPSPSPVTRDEIAPPSASAASSENANGSSSPPKLVGHTLTLSPKGFEQSCREPVLSVASSDGGTRVIARTLPPKGNYFLDDEYVGYGTCDLITCNPAHDRQVDLVEYEKIGTKPAPGGQGNALAFRTVDLKGTITVTLDTFSDEKCSVPKPLTQTVTR